MQLTSTMPLRSLRTELKNLAHIKRMRQLNTISSSTGLTVSVLSFLMVLIVTFVLIIFCKNVKRQAQNNEVDQNLDTGLPLRNLNRPFSAWWGGHQEDRVEIRTDVERNTLTSDINVNDNPSGERAALVSDSLVPRSPTITRPSIHPRQIYNTDRHTCTLTGSQALRELEVTHVDDSCPRHPLNMGRHPQDTFSNPHSQLYPTQRTSAPEI